MLDKTRLEGVWDSTCCTLTRLACYTGRRGLRRACMQSADSASASEPSTPPALQSQHQEACHLEPQLHCFGSERCSRTEL